MREMKDSGIEWIGAIPFQWLIDKLKYHLKRNEPKNPGEQIVLSLYRELGVIPKDSRDDNHNVTSEDTSNYKYVRIGDFVINKMKAWQGSVAVSDYEGIVSPAYYIYNFTDTVFYKKYFHYLLRSCYKDEFRRLSGGIREGQWDLPAEALNNTPVLIPTLSEQQTIACFLDRKSAECDALVADIQKQIDTLEEYKRSLIFDTICHGICNEKQKNTDSDVWTEIPVSWDLRDIKYIFEIVKRIAGKEGFDVLSVTQKGLKVKNLNDNGGQLAENYSGYQFVYPTDYVMNHMDLLTGWVDCSTLFGVTSPDYRVFRLRDKKRNDLTYFKYVMQCCYLCRIFYSLGQGVSNLGRWRLQTSSFNNFRIPVPPLEQQKIIADYLDSKCAEIDSIISEKEQQIATIEEYKKSLIFEYVTGKKKVTTQAIVIDPRVILAGIVLSKLGANLKGKIQVQKIMFLCETMLGLPFQTQYFRYPHGPYDKNINTYFTELNSNQWFIIQDGSPMTCSNGSNFSDFENEHLTTFSKYTAEIERIIKFIAPMKTSQAERIATLFAVWNDLIIDGINNPSDEQIINEVITNWTPNKANSAIETWKGSLDKMKKNGIIPKGLGKHTQQKDI